MTSTEYEYSQICRVRPIGADAYEVVVGNKAGHEEILTCAVRRDNDKVAVTDISPTHDPSAVFEGRVDTRRVASAVLAYIEAEKTRSS